MSRPFYFFGRTADGCTSQVSRSVNFSLGALRKLGKHRNLTVKNSLHIARAAYSLVQLGTELVHGSPAPPSEPDIMRRTHFFEQSAALQRSLEVQHRLSHDRSLKTTLDKAAQARTFSPRALRKMETVVQNGNAARHQRWTPPAGTTQWRPVEGSKLRKDAPVFTPATRPGAAAEEEKPETAPATTQEAVKHSVASASAAERDAAAWHCGHDLSAVCHAEVQWATGGPSAPQPAPGIAYPSADRLSEATAAAVRDAATRKESRRRAT